MKVLLRGIHVEFPERVFTEAEVKVVKELIEKGYKHELQVNGSQEFEKKMIDVLELIKTAGYYEFLRTYIREIKEIEGFSQLHEADVVIWANMPLLADLVDAASFIVQKAQQMKDYIEGKPYYGTGEIASIEERLEFLRKLRETSKNEEIKQRCDELLKQWEDTKMMFP